MPEMPSLLVWTPEMLSRIQEGAFFAKGFFVDDASGINIADTGNLVKWVAVKGDVEDWCIYYQNPHEGTFTKDFYDIAINGDKLHYASHIMQLVYATPEMMNLYRY